MPAPAIETQGLTKVYGRRTGIRDLTLEVRRGEVFGYLGPNGAGKTTTIRTLLDLIRPTAGTARVLGFDIRRESAEVRRRTGYLPGDLTLAERMRGGELLEYLGHLRGGVDRREIAGLAERLGCDLGVPVRALSHGNRQKLGLIQAFMHRPELLILDEPTQGLDPLVQQEFAGLVEEARAQGRTVFLSSHVLPEVQRLCDRVGIIRDGALVAVEDVGAMTSRTLRVVAIHFDEPVPPGVFAGLPGVRSAQAQGDVVRLEVVGSVDAVVKAASRFTVVDIDSHEAGLEEVFLAYYDAGARNGAAAGRSGNAA